MAKEKKSGGRSKEFRNIITAKLEAALLEYKESAGEKRFASSVKKAGKILSEGLMPKKEKKKKKDKKDTTQNTGPE